MPFASVFTSLPIFRNAFRIGGIGVSCLRRGGGGGWGVPEIVKKNGEGGPEIVRKGGESERLV